MRPLGIRIPVIPVKGYSMTVPREPWPDAPEMQIVDDDNLFGLNPLGGDRLRLAGLAEIAGYAVPPGSGAPKRSSQGSSSAFRSSPPASLRRHRSLSVACGLSHRVACLSSVVLVSQISSIMSVTGILAGR